MSGVQALRRVLALLVVLCVAAAAQDLPSRETVESFLSRMFGHDAELTWRVLEIKASPIRGVAHVTLIFSNQDRATHLYVMPDGEHAIVGELVPFGADPFERVQRRLRDEAMGPARGPREAKVTIVEFADLQCPTCRRTQPVIERLLADFPRVRFVFQHFPLPQHRWAREAAAFAECLHEQDQEGFWKWVQAVYDQQKEITVENAKEKLATLAGGAGADGVRASACAARPEVQARVQKSVELGESLGVHATPTLFINGRKLTGVVNLPYEGLKRLIEFEAEQAD